MEKQKQQKISSGMAVPDDASSLGSISISRVIKIEDEVDIPWLTVNDNRSRGNVEVKSEFDDSIQDELREFIDSFRNSMVVKVKNLLAPQKNTSNVSNNNHSAYNGANFKTFRKVRFGVYRVLTILYLVLEL